MHNNHNKLLLMNIMHQVLLNNLNIKHRKLKYVKYGQGRINLSTNGAFAPGVKC